MKGSEGESRLELYSSHVDRRNAEFIDDMIKDPVFADMLEDGDERERAVEQSGAHSHEHGHSSSHGHSHSHEGHSHSRPGSKSSSSKPSQGDNDLAQDKIRSTLRSLVRDWAVEGQVERDACYQPILQSLEKYFPAEAGRDRATRKVLVPGCGMGRLAMEIAARGKYFSRQTPWQVLMCQASSRKETNSPLTCSSLPISC